MARKRTTAQAAENPMTEAPATTATAVQPPPADAYDQAAERHETARQAVEQVAASTKMPDATDHPRKYATDPIRIKSVLLGPNSDSPKMALYRSNRRGEMAIQFDEKPDAKYTAQLRESGFHWDRDEGVWTKPFVQEDKWKDHLDAEKTFSAIANSIRADHGLEPTQTVGVA